MFRLGLPLALPAEAQAGSTGVLVQVLPGFVNEDVRPALWFFVPQFLRDLTASIEWTCMPATMHALSLAAFASIIGPFGAPPCICPVPALRSHQQDDFDQI